ncbi:MAG: DUF4402 domain-containing protein [Bacteroidales bacterium]
MARLAKIFLSLVLLLNYLTGVHAQSLATATATGHITAEIIPVFAASETAQMNFGRFNPGPQGGELVLTPQGSISVMGSVFVGTGGHNAGSFYLTGGDDNSFSISLPNNPVILTNIGSSRTMLVENWVSVPSAGIGTGMLQKGFQIVNVGATLKVGTLNDNPIGMYTGSYSITFDFN